MGLFVVPSICITPAPDNIVFAPESQFYAHSDVNPSVQRLKLDVPPRPADCSARRHLVQHGQRLGSFRLNCAESAQYPFARSAGIASSRRLFNWSKSPPLLVPTGGVPMARSQRGHTRARSLNSLAELNDTLKVNGVCTNNQIPIAHRPVIGPGNNSRSESRTMSIDLTILNNVNSYSTSYEFATPL